MTFFSFMPRRAVLGGVLVAATLFLAFPLRAADAAEGVAGYYRFPTVFGDTIVFTAEGDLWRVGITGGVARRLTSHQGEEAFARISPDGKTLAFSAEYEGPTEVYTMPLTGGVPVRRTFDGEGEVAGWTPDGKILYATTRRSTLPDTQLATLDLATGVSTLLPLSQASQGSYDATGKTIFFTRLPHYSGATKRYRGGTARNIWKYTEGAPEATPLTADFEGVSLNPMWWQGRVYYLTERDGTMNLWSMNPDGGDQKQHTRLKGQDAKGASLGDGKIVYQSGADIHLYDIAADKDALVPITLASDFDQERERWVKNPMAYVTAAHISPSGDKVVLTARGQIFVAPVGPGRFVEITPQPKVRYRQAQFLPDGKSLMALSDESGELEFARMQANGLGKVEQLSSDGKVFRFDGEPSPDGKWIAYNDKNFELWLFNVSQKTSKKIDASNVGEISGMTWSPDSQWLAYESSADNTFVQIWLHRVSDGKKFALTSDRVSSYSPAWSGDGKWIYYLSDRTLRSVVPSPWGARQPEPYFDKTARIYATPLAKDQRSPFEPADESQPEPKPVEKPKRKDPDLGSPRDRQNNPRKPRPPKPPPAFSIDVDALPQRVMAVPMPSGNYESLSMADRKLFWISREGAYGGRRTLMTMDISSDDPKPRAFAEDVGSYELSADRRKLLLRKGDTFYVEDTGSGSARYDKSANLRDWTFSLNPRDEWRQMFTEAWRLERDYFYDRKMHAVDWPAILKKYLPLVDRVTDRAELRDLLAEMVGELSALHTFVYGGDQRDGPDQIQNSGLGATLVKDAASGGWRIEHIYRSDPDYPPQGSPLLKPGLNLKEGLVIQQINGTPLASVAHPELLLRNHTGKQVLLRVGKPGDSRPWDVIVTPISLGEEWNLRYSEWEYTRRQRVEELGKGDIGYLHLRAMGQGDIGAWARDFYPVFNRKGLIIDVRHNGGGNIDSWILEKLMRKAWFFWQGRAGSPTWNMQYAFRGHMVVLCDAHTGSDGEAFTEGFKRLGLGKVIGTRTWGGEIWLTSSNFLVDHGIATAAEFGVYGPEGKWLIENHGVDPDIVVDNLPHATFQGGDAQLQRAIEYLQQEIKDKPVVIPPPPPYPDKSLK